MAFFQRLRTSPVYLYLKCYLICALVSLFGARPVSSHFHVGGAWGWYDVQGQDAPGGGEGADGADGGVRAGAPDGAVRADAAAAGGPLSEEPPVGTPASGRTPQPTTAPSPRAPIHAWWQERRFPFLFPPPQLPLNLPPPPRRPKLPWLQRWRWRWHDLTQVRALMAQDNLDEGLYPELAWDATVRTSSALHPDEAAFMRKRQTRISSAGTDALAKFLRLPPGERVHPDDVPLVAIGGSGGGYRAMFGYAGFIKEAANTGLWQCTTWCSGVSGSCWTVAAYYAVASCSTDVLVAHLLAMAHEETHPMSISAMDRIARSSRGIYYLLAPLLRKVQSRSMSCRIMDFYATLFLSYQFLPRPLALFGTEHSYNGPQPHRATTVDGTRAPGMQYEPSEGLSRKSFQWSKVWQRARLDEGAEPMPILTGVRRVWRPRRSAVSGGGRRAGGAGVPGDRAGCAGAADSAAAAGGPPASVSPGRGGAVPAERRGAVDVPAAAGGPPALAPAGCGTTAEDTAAADGSPPLPPSPELPLTTPAPPLGSGYDWYEITPLELGSRNVGAWIPTWGYGRRFENGRSTERVPEAMLSMVVGQCTGAPAGPLSAYIDTMLASMPQGTVMNTLLRWANNFVKMKRWEKRWGNPIRAADEPNPWYGRGADDHVVPIAPHANVPKEVVADAREESAADAQKEAAVPVDEGVEVDDARAVSPWGSESAVHAPAPAPCAPSDGAPPMSRELEFSTPPQTPRVVEPCAWVDAAQGDRARGGDAAWRLPRLPQLAGFSQEEAPRMGNTRPRHRQQQSDASTTSSMSHFDPDAFVAPMEEQPPAEPRTGADAAWPQAAANGTRAPQQRTWAWEHSRRLRLLDSGLSNNLPNHVLAREERHADVIISFDASSDVKTGAAIARLYEFGDECGLRVQPHADTVAADERAREARARYAADDVRTARPRTNRTPDPASLQHGFDAEAERIRAENEPLYAQRYEGWRHKHDHIHGTDRDPDVRLIYCPLFPNATQPGFDPTTAHYSTSYNLIWTADQVRALLRTAMANVEEGSSAIETIRAAVRDAYEEKKARRLGVRAAHPVRSVSNASKALRADGVGGSSVALASPSALLPDVRSPPKTHGVQVATLQLKSYGQRTFDLDFFADFAMRAAHALQIPTGGIASLPTRTSLWTVPRGPFVHKKSQENFWRRTHRRSLVAYDASDATVDRWLQFLRHHEMAGVAAKAMIFRYYPLGIGRQLQVAVPAQGASDEALVQELARDILRMQMDGAPPSARDGPAQS
ncbi:phospholipase A2 [Malassezia sp. CBS 17886]|nr:phospholipase A2 [Malassezia sp. CBS 17886]